MMKTKILLLFFVFLLLCSFTSAWDRSDFLQHVETKVDITEAFTHYRVCNPTAQDYVISTDLARRFDVGFNKVRGDLTDYHFELWKNVSVNVTVPDYGLVEHSYVCNASFNYTASPKYAWCFTNDTNGTNVIFEHSFTRGNVPAKTIWWNESELTGSHVESVLQEQWTRFSPLGKTFQSGRCYDVKIVGNYQASTEGIAIDNVITYQNVSFDEYAWWNVTWQRKYQLNATTVASAPYWPFRVVLNSSYITMSDCQADGGDVRIVNSTEDGAVVYNLSSWDGTTGVLYINESLQTSNFSGWLYCNTSSMQTTSSSALPEVGLGYGVLHSYNLDEATGNATDYLNSLNLTQVGTVPNRTGLISNARGEYSTSNYFYAAKTSINTSLPYSLSVWIKYNGGSMNVYQGIFGTMRSDGALVYMLRIHSNNQVEGYVFRGTTICNPLLTVSWVNQSWYHLFLRSNGDNCTLYVNNSNELSSNMTGVSYSGSYLNIGSSFYSSITQPAVTFYVDEAVIWNRDLLVAERNLVYNNHGGLAYPFYALPQYSVGNSVYNSPPVIVINLTTPSIPVYFQNISLNITVREPENDTITWANFTLVAKNGSIVVDNVNGTCAFSNASANESLCYSSVYYLNSSVWNETDGFGIWSFNYTIDDNTTYNSLLTGVVNFTVNNTDGPNVSVTGPSGTVASKVITASYSVSRIIKDAPLYCFANVTYSTNMSALAEGSINCSATSAALGSVATDGDYIVYVRALETKNGVNYTTVSSSSFTVNTVVPAGGGGGASTASVKCSIDVVSPLSQIGMYGTEGLMSNPASFNVKNSISSTVQLSYSLSDSLKDDCRLNATGLSASGNSVVTNSISCLFKGEKYSGKITVTGDSGDCSTSVNVVVGSSWWARLYDIVNGIVSFEAVSVGGMSISLTVLFILGIALLSLLGFVLIIFGAG